jgi:hypothetical protein
MTVLGILMFLLLYRGRAPAAGDVVSFAIYPPENASFRHNPLFPNNLEYLVSTEVAARNRATRWICDLKPTPSEAPTNRG